MRVGARGRDGKSPAAGNAPKIQQYAPGQSLCGSQARGVQQPRGPADHEVEARHGAEERQPQEQRSAREQQSERGGAVAEPGAHRRLGQDAQHRRAHPLEQRIQPAQRLRRAARDQEIERLRQPTRGDQQQCQRHRTTNRKGRTPAVARNGHCGQRAADGRADRVAGCIGSEGRAAPSVRGILGHDDRSAGDRAADPDAGQGPQRQQIREAACGRGKQHSESRDHPRQEDDPAPAPVVGARCQKQRAQSHADETGAQQRPELRILQAPRGLDARGGEGHRENVEAVEHVESDAHRDGGELKRGERPVRDPLRSFIYHAADRAVRDVFVAGQRVVADRRVLTMNQDDAADRLAGAQHRMLEAAARRDYRGRGAEQISPLSLPLAD